MYWTSIAQITMNGYQLRGRSDREKTLIKNEHCIGGHTVRFGSDSLVVVRKCMEGMRAKYHSLLEIFNYCFMEPFGL